jgi:hypothetical protein
MDFHVILSLCVQFIMVTIILLTVAVYAHKPPLPVQQCEYLIPLHAPYQIYSARISARAEGKTTTQ